MYGRGIGLKKSRKRAENDTIFQRRDAEAQSEKIVESLWRLEFVHFADEEEKKNEKRFF